MQKPQTYPCSTNHFSIVVILLLHIKQLTVVFVQKRWAKRWQTAADALVKFGQSLSHAHTHTRISHITAVVKGNVSASPTGTHTHRYIHVYICVSVPTKFSHYMSHDLKKETNNLNSADCPTTEGGRIHLNLLAI